MARMDVGAGAEGVVFVAREVEAILAPLRKVREIGEQAATDVNDALMRLRVAGQMLESTIAFLERVKQLAEARESAGAKEEGSA